MHQAEQTKLELKEGKDALNRFLQVESSIPYRHYSDRSMLATVVTFIADIFSQPIPKELYYYRNRSLDRAMGHIWLVIFGSLIVCFFLFLLIPTIIFSMLFILLAFVGVYFILTASYMKPCHITLNSSKLVFPEIFGLPLKFKLSRSWDELDSIVFTRAGKPDPNPDHLSLCFQDKSVAKFKIDGFSKADLEKLLLGLRTYRPELKQLPENKSLRLELNVDDQKGNPLSFTNLWQAELSSRFGSTAYVPLESGDTLQSGSLKVIGQIAYSGLSAIYLAERNDKKIIVLKESVLPLSADQDSKTKAEEMFKREAQLLSRINHPAIVSVFDYFIENERHYIQLQYVEGKNLRVYVKENGPQDEEKVKMWAGHMSNIVSYLHNLDPPVIHRDLTPDNFMVGVDGGITLIDFGASNTFLGTATGTVVGKSAYMPIEQFKGAPSLSSDIYALGGTLYFLLTGKDPIPFSTSDLSSEGRNTSLNKLIVDSTQVKPQARISDIETFSKRLENAKDHK